MSVEGHKQLEMYIKLLFEKILKMKVLCNAKCHEPSGNFCHQIRVSLYIGPSSAACPFSTHFEVGWTLSKDLYQILFT